MRIRRIALPFTLLLAASASAQLPKEPASVRVGVFSLFHPYTLMLSADHTLTFKLDGKPQMLDAHQTVTIQATATGLIANSTAADTLTLAPGTFTLAVPGKLTRDFRGALTISAHYGVLTPIIAMDTETAVASIVAAESPPNAPIEALKAQAITSRSFLLANPHAHAAFEACDTTHCQFLRSPPAAGSPAAKATRATQNMVLAWRASPEAQPQIVRAMYSRSCGGQTHVPAASSSEAYPFYSVRCAFCLRHPLLKANSHGIGLCQLGAADFAQRGATYTHILNLYFPNTTLATIP